MNEREVVAVMDELEQTREPGAYWDKFNEPRTQEALRGYVVGLVGMAGPSGQLAGKSGGVDGKDVDHVCHGIRSMVAELCGKHPGGDFARSFLDNDLMGVLSRADDVNIRALSVYAKFLHNRVPGKFFHDRKERIAAKAKERDF